MEKRRLRPASGLLSLSLFFGLMSAQGQCNQPDAHLQEQIARYAGLKFHVDPTMVRIASLKRVEPSCFWAIDLTATSRRTLTLYLSPDMRFLTPALYDLQQDPLEEERHKAQELGTRLTKDRSPKEGAQNPLVTVVIFSDLECPYCSRLNTAIQAFRQTPSSADVQFVFRHYPLPMHPWAEAAARLSDCIYHQNERAFWDYTNYLFQNQESLSIDGLNSKTTAFISERGVHVDVPACIADPTVGQEIQRDLDLGRSVDVSVTPTLFVNGLKYSGTQTLTQIEDLVTKARNSMQKAQK